MLLWVPENQSRHRNPLRPTRRKLPQNDPYRRRQILAQICPRHLGFIAALLNLRRACTCWDDGAVGPRLVGVPGMSILPRAMAAGINVQSDRQVTAVRAVPGGWELDIGLARIETHCLFITVPAPQAAALLGVGHAVHRRIAKVVMAPCLTLMAALPKGVPRPFLSRSSDDHPLTWIAQDSSKPGRASTLSTWAAQASAEWSEQHLEETPDVIAARMLPMLADVIGVAPQLAVYAAAHGWR